MRGKFSKYKAISMQEFLEKYFMIYNNIDHINHYDVTELNLQGIKRVPDDIVSDEDIKTGRVILVESTGSHHRGRMVCAYLRPDIVLYKEEMTKLDEMIFNALYKDDCSKVKLRKRSK